MCFEKMCREDRAQQSSAESILNLIPFSQVSQDHLGGPWLQLVGPPAGSCLGCFGFSDASSGSLMMGLGVVSMKEEKTVGTIPSSLETWPGQKVSCRRIRVSVSISSTSSVWQLPQVPEKS